MSESNEMSQSPQIGSFISMTKRPTARRFWRSVSIPSNRVVHFDVRSRPLGRHWVASVSIPSNRVVHFDWDGEHQFQSFRQVSIPSNRVVHFDGEAGFIENGRCFV